MKLPHKTQLLLAIILAAAGLAAGLVYHNSKLEVALNVGEANVGWTTVVIDSAPGGPWGKQFADVDGDGRLDAITGGGFVNGVLGATRDTNVHWYKNPGPAGGAWTKYKIGSNSGGNDLAVGDIDGDGFLDVAVNGQQDGGLTTANGGIRWYRNPRGSGGNPQNLWGENVVDATNNGHDLILADIDRDGRLDIVARQPWGPTHIYFQNSPTSWVKVHLPQAPDGEGAAVADIDLDGRLDVIGNGYWLKQPANPRTETWTKFTFTPWGQGSSVAVTDINRDGRPDIFIAHSERGTDKNLAWFEGPANPTAVSAWTRHNIGAVEEVHRFHLVDVDRDGDLDVVFAEMHQSSTDRVGVFYNNGSGSSWTLQIIANTAGHNIAVGDYDGDGDIDILSANWNKGAPDGGKVTIFRNDSSAPAKKSLDSWTYKQIDNSRGQFSASPYRSYFGLAFKDVNGNGFKDIASGRYFYRNPGGDMTGAWPRVDFGLNVDAMLFVDVDGDQFADVIAQSLPNVYWLEANDVNGTSWTARQVATLIATPHTNGQGYASGQINPGHPKEEIVFSTGAGIWYITVPLSNPAAGGWKTTRITSEGSEQGLALGDINRDGCLDLIAFTGAISTPNTVSWWQNPCNGGADWVKRNIGTSSANGSFDRVAVADLNGDGRLDVIATEENSGGSANASTFWFEQPTNIGGTWTRRTITTQYTTNAMSVADVDQDGHMDVITGEHRGNKQVAIWRNDGTGLNWTKHLADSGKESHLGARVVDLDNDGDLDIVSIAWDSFQFMHMWRNNAQAASGGGGLDTTPPSRSSGAPSGTLPSGTTQTTLSLATNEPATCKYGTAAGTAYSSLPSTFSTTGLTSHSTTVSGLKDGSSYAYYVRCSDAVGNANTDDFVISFAVAAPAAACPATPTSFPNDRWDRVWCNAAFTSKLADTPDETNEQFDTDWSMGTVAGIRTDDIGFRSGRTIAFPVSGEYTFTVGSDDGARVYIDNVLVLDKWINRAYTTDTFTRNLSAGDHQVRIDFYEGSGFARVSFKYTAPESPPPPPPPGCVDPSPLPSGFAAPCPVLSLSATSVSKTGSVTVTATPPSSLASYQYKTIYLSDPNWACSGKAGGFWCPLTLGGTSDSQAPAYVTKNTAGTLNLTSSILSNLSSGTHYVLSWDWAWDQNSNCYKGPGLNTCNTGAWRVQTFNVQ